MVAWEMGFPRGRFVFLHNVTAGLNKCSVSIDKNCIIFSIHQPIIEPCFKESYEKLIVIMEIAKRLNSLREFREKANLSILIKAVQLTVRSPFFRIININSMTCRC